MFVCYLLLSSIVFSQRDHEKVFKVKEETPGLSSQNYLRLPTVLLKKKKRGAGGCSRQRIHTKQRKTRRQGLSLWSTQNRRGNIFRYIYIHLTADSEHHVYGTGGVNKLK